MTLRSSGSEKPTLSFRAAELPVVDRNTRRVVFGKRCLQTFIRVPARSRPTRQLWILMEENEKAAVESFIRECRGLPGAKCQAPGEG